MPARSYSYLATNIRSVVWFISAEKQIYKKRVFEKYSYWNFDEDNSIGTKEVQGPKSAQETAVATVITGHLLPPIKMNCLKHSLSYS